MLNHNNQDQIKLKFIKLAIYSPLLGTLDHQDMVNGHPNGQETSPGIPVIEEILTIPMVTRGGRCPMFGGPVFTDRRARECSCSDTVSRATKYRMARGRGPQVSPPHSV